MYVADHCADVLEQDLTKASARHIISAVAEINLMGGYHAAQKKEVALNAQHDIITDVIKEHEKEY